MAVRISGQHKIAAPRASHAARMASLPRHMRRDLEEKLDEPTEENQGAQGANHEPGEYQLDHVVGSGFKFVKPHRRPVQEPAGASACTHTPMLQM
jgi:hypothetical protein